MSEQGRSGKRLHEAGWVEQRRIRCVVMGDLLRPGVAKILLDLGGTAKGGCWGEIKDEDPADAWTLKYRKKATLFS